MDTPDLAPSRGGRRPRLSEEAVRQRMLDAALEVVTARGLTVSLAHLSFEAVIHAADVPRSAGYRVWSSKEAFFDELLLHVATAAWRDIAGAGQTSIAMAYGVIEERVGDLGTPRGRREALLRSTAAAAAHSEQLLATSPHWRTYVATLASMLSLPAGSELRTRLEQALHEAEQHWLATMAMGVEEFCRLLGQRLRPGATWADMATATTLVSEGAGLRRVLTPVESARTIDGLSFEGMTLPGLNPGAAATVAVVAAYTEPDPDFDEAALAVIRQALPARPAADPADTGGAGPSVSGGSAQVVRSTP